MRGISKIFSILAVSVLFSGLIFGQAFIRVGEIPVPTDEASWGNVISGVDLDGDGLKEIYAVNNNWNDGGFPGELVPKIYKYEFDGFGGFQLVWSAVSDIPLQNTWPALTYGDWDADGKWEVIWGPVNFFSGANPNPSRILVYESVGDGSDNMGVSDGSGGWLPNARTSITTSDNQNLRAIRWHLVDVDSDGALELVYSSRVSAAGEGNRFGVISVSDIPDNGDGSEVWTIEADDNAGVMTGSTSYDVAVMGSTVYVIHDNGDVTPIEYSGGVWTIGTPVASGGTGTWQSAQTLDIDGDGTEEMILPSWSAPAKVFLVQGSGAAVTFTEIADLTGLVGASARLYGSDFGDIDGNGNVDIVMGTRGATPDAAIIRMEYLGGDITQAASYQATIIDQEYSAATGGRWMTISVGNIDKDPKLEVIYTEGTGNQEPMVIIDIEGVVPVELTSFSATASNGYVTLKWDTQTETNNHGFEVQRMSGNTDFTTIGFVQGKGSTTDPQSYQFVDKNTEFGTYTYRLKQVDLNGYYSFSDEIEVNFNVPVEFNLTQNYPNPFNPSTTISFGIPEASNVNLRIFNLLGEQVATIVSNEFKEAGTYQVSFNASGLASGTYIYTLQAGDQVQSKKMILMK